MGMMLGPGLLRFLNRPAGRGCLCRRAGTHGYRVTALSGPDATGAVRREASQA